MVTFIGDTSRKEGVDGFFDLNVETTTKLGVDDDVFLQFCSLLSLLLLCIFHCFHGIGILSNSSLHPCCESASDLLCFPFSVERGVSVRKLVDDSQHG